MLNESKNCKNYMDCEDILKYFALCQISRCKFKFVDLRKFIIFNDKSCQCSARDKNNAMTLVYIKKSMKVTEFLKEIENFIEENMQRNIEESSLNLLRCKINNEIAKKKQELRPHFGNEAKIEKEMNRCLNLFDILEQYKLTYYKSGKEIKGMVLYKMYSEKEKNLNVNLRNKHGAKWIDYNNQLTKNDIISDDGGICGLWSMKPECAKKCICSKECRDRYGDWLFELEPIDDCNYFITDTEVIGDKYRVVKNFSLKSCNDIRKAISHLENKNISD